jgi:Dolichyl-phosphate-mannose-protein mannosyltransferase
MARGAQRFRWGLAACAAGAAVVRLAVYFRYYRATQFGFNDAPYYSQTAIALADGRGFVDFAGRPAAEHGPVTTLLLAPVSWIDTPEDWQRLVTVLTGVAAVVVIGLVGRRLGGDRVGLVAAALAALYPGLWLNDGLVMSESPGALSVALWMLAALVWHARPTPVWAAVMGLAAGVAALTRPELGVLMFAGVVAAWRLGGDRRWLMAALAAAAGLLVLAPWVAFNLGRFERPVILTTNDGTTLRGANCDPTYEGRALGSWAVECLVIDPGVAGMEGSLRGARWRADGIEYARDHAGRIPVVMLARLGRSLDLYGLGYQVDEDMRDGRPRLGSWAAIVSFWVLAALAVVGQRRATPFGRFVLWAPVAAVLLTAVVFYGGHRVRTAMEPSVVLGAALAVVALVERRLAPGSGPAVETDDASPSSPEREATSTSALSAT